MRHDDVKKLMWGLLALAESLLAFMLARPAVVNVLRIAFTRQVVLVQHSGYFAGMLFGDLVRLLISWFLAHHAFRIVRKLIIKRLA
ncbi:MAG TPA: hypothetical protein VK763_06820 [Terriglobales bacterium]|jgi:hypothetical protein|nr:hypothetical protein [Terriglobales bacterium]